MSKTWVIGSRGSDLALWQARFLQDQLKKLGAASEIKIIKTQGDQIQHLSFDKLEGKGFFTKEIEEALLQQHIDIAVHSHKDLETAPVEGLAIAAVSYRENPAELLLIRKEKYDPSRPLGLPENAILGTSSARRKNQALLFRPDLEIRDLRGNVPTRVQKLRDGGYDAILLARAGVDRLNLDLTGLHVEVLDPRHFIPPPAQGVLAFQVRSDDAEAVALIGQLNQPEVAACIGVERKVLRMLNGGCRLPLGVYCEKKENRYHVWASLSEQVDATPQRTYVEASSTDGLAEDILNRLQTKQNLRVLVTRELDNDSLLRRLLEAAGCTVTGESFIRFEPVEVREVPPSDWLFFSSKNAVKYFLGTVGNPHAAKIAAVGEATASAIRQLGMEVDFVGDHSDTTVVAEAFRNIAGKANVLFPGSDISVRTVQKCFPDDQVTDLVVYRTLDRNDVSVPEFDAVIFTSPSNVNMFFRHAQLNPQRHRVVVMGITTGKALEASGFSKYVRPWSASEEALADTLLSSYP
ncbi:MAG: hydroxymethylbilane synthase [Flavobacteriales bacterium]|nr:hydroxymethylbilane synthase [Flavobacteriales bacterium]MCB9449584.1 hydroxymethylbilane synthase [Flavobacteriales bacterium]